MKKVTLLVLLFMFVLSGISMARDSGSGWRGHGNEKGALGMPHGKWWKMPQMADKLALTKEEKGKLDTTYLEHRHQMIDLRSQVEKERLELERLLDSSTFNATACMDRFKKLQEAHNNLAIERFKLLVQVRELLGLERFMQLKDEVRRYRMKQEQGRRNSSKGDIRAR